MRKITCEVFLSTHFVQPEKARVVSQETETHYPCGPAFQSIMPIIVPAFRTFEKTSECGQVFLFECCLVVWHFLLKPKRVAFPWLHAALVHGGDKDG